MGNWLLLLFAFWGGVFAPLVVRLALRESKQAPKPALPVPSEAKFPLPPPAAPARPTGPPRDAVRSQGILEALVVERTARLHHRAEQLRMINTVGSKIVAIHNLDELLPFVANELCQSFEYECVNIFLVSDDPEVLRLRASSGSYGSRPKREELRVGGQGINGWVAGAGQPLMVNDVSKEARYMMLPELKETAAELTVPIRLGDQVLGVLDIESQQKNAFDETDLSTAQTLADLIAVAIENARLYDTSRELAVTEERNRLAREIHDTIAQGLTALAMQLELADAALPADIRRAREAIRRALGLARLNLEEARRSVQNLRSRSLQRKSLADAIRLLLDQGGREHGYYYSFRHNVDHELSPAIETGIYRIAQEALSNIARHAQASEVTVLLDVGADTLTLTVEDDGVGFDPAEFAQAGHFGLMGMQERAHLLGGKLLIASSPGDGTRLEAQMPLVRPS